MSHSHIVCSVRSSDMETVQVARTNNETRVCGDCWHILRPDSYEPMTFIDGTCSMCGAEATYIHRVRKAEVQDWRDMVAAELQQKAMETVRNDS